jgi:seryl-tRNA synthetase
LVAAQAELATMREQLAAKSDEANVAEQLSAALTERQQLEAELDLLRRRAAELSDALGEQKRQVSDEREKWSEELRQLRRAVDRQSELLVQRGPVVAGETIVASGETRPNPAPKNDQVIDAVREQFEILQKNKIRKMANANR